MESMLYFAGIAVCYLLFFLYDLNQLYWRRKLLSGSFLAACAGNVLLVVLACRGEPWLPARLVPGGLLALVFLGLLLYTLFFALPFEKTYVEAGSGRSAYRRGVYALCRHPGVLWYAGLLFCLYWAFGGMRLLVLAVFGTLFDILYVWFQDRFIFPRQFSDYESYQKEAPFLVPTPSSMQRCIRTWREGGDR